MMLAEVFSMNGYGVYVWASYGIAFAILGLNVFLARGYRKKVLSKVILNSTNTQD
ncbi:MAG: heme exporter protein CcmD [Proteobacteria bacterium]|nr:heme exporter protein CcmD [Pseudomonadota bacterium]